MKGANPYQTFLLANRTRIYSIESSLKSLTWFLPGRFQDSELASEALYSFLNLVSLYHSHILLRSNSSSSSSSISTPQPPHTRYTLSSTLSSSLYSSLAHSLSILSTLQLLLEMSVRKKLGGTKQSEKLVIAIEGLKCLLRLSLLRLGKGRMLLGCMIPEREEGGPMSEVEGSETPADTTNGLPPPPPLLLPRSSADLLPNSPTTTWTSRTTSLSHPTLASLHPSTATTASKESIKDYLLTHVLLTKEEALLASELVRVRGGNWEKMSEVVWCLRPFIYVLALKKYGPTHTLPYLLSLSLEYFAYSLRKSSTQSRNQDLTSVERDEISRRKWNFIWYAVRGPVWSRVTKPQLESLALSLAHKPILGMFSTILSDYLPLVDENYFYTAT